jgi:hypothetical protein
MSITLEEIVKLRTEYSSLEAAVAAYVTRKNEMESLEAQIKARTTQLDAEMETIKDDILYEMDQQKLTKISTPHGSVSRASKDTPFVKPESWGEVYTYIRESGRFDLLQKRLTTTVATAIILGDPDLNIQPQIIPGVGMTRVSSIRVTRSKIA